MEGHVSCNLELETTLGALVSTPVPMISGAPGSCLVFCGRWISFGSGIVRLRSPVRSLYYIDHISLMHQRMLC